MKFSIVSDSPEQTEQIAKKIGNSLRGGEVIELISELGGGKTTFTHGLAEGINSNDKVASPTFTISRVYQGDELKIYHFDFYRLNDDKLIKYELSDVLDDKNNVVVIEWPGLVEEVLPSEKLTVKFMHINENRRELLFTYPKNLSYLMSSYVDTSSSNG